MSMLKETLYRKRRCDFCGRTVFEKMTGENVLDGGYTRNLEFEVSDIESVYVSGNLKETDLDGYACESCRNKIINHLKPFIISMKNTAVKEVPSDA